jgi:hypothetical protein
LQKIHGAVRGTQHALDNIDEIVRSISGSGVEGAGGKGLCVLAIIGHDAEFTRRGSPRVALDSHLENLSAIVQRLVGAGCDVVALTPIPFLTHDPPVSDEECRRHEVLNQSIMLYTEAARAALEPFGVTLIDSAAILRNEAECYDATGAELDEPGASRIAEAVAAPLVIASPPRPTAEVH